MTTNGQRGNRHTSRRESNETTRASAGCAGGPGTRSFRAGGDGETLVTDGPFAETKEQLGGYYVIDAKDADEAFAIAARIPGAQYGSIEVRPLMVFEG